ncbi:hypothetical protein HPB51_001555 [Rhipicephalus microplus]|uniref:Uncharacterized protein n=1 Tax=Rhipicephalus microplus TaxID=6941 RepID=A0A9J6EWC6_RHIMP|nr:hypothetical protein HPB51_001555 [Rhipicephalus microplus]
MGMSEKSPPTPFPCPFPRGMGDCPPQLLITRVSTGSDERTIQSVARLNAPNVRPMVMVTMEPGFLASLPQRAVVNGHAGRLARNVGRWLLQRGYIGVDLDLWTPSNRDEANASYYAAIVSAMKRTLDTGRLLLSTNVYPIPGLMEDMQLAKLRGDVHLMVLNPCVDTSEPCPLTGTQSWASILSVPGGHFLF